MTTPFEPWRARILDGATGTELHSRGVDTSPPLWSARALLDGGGRDTLAALHTEYVKAGADVITANTFRCHRRSLAKAHLGDRAPDLVRSAVAIARRAAGGRALVAGSLAPLEDCYRPDLVPPDADLAAEHAEMAAFLAAAGCDVALVETMNSIREAVAASRAAIATGLPTLACFVCGSNGRLLSGERLADAAAAVVNLGVCAVGVNCTGAPAVAACLAELPAGVPHVAYANVADRTPDGHWIVTDALDPNVYARYAATWDARLIGGCCGTTPAHIRRVAERLRGVKALAAPPWPPPEPP